MGNQNYTFVLKNQTKFEYFFISDENTKDVMIAVTFGKDFLFLPEFLQTLENLDYPKEHICLHITVQNSTKYDFIKSTINSWRPKYQNIKFLPSANAAKAKQDAIHYAKNFRVNYILFLSSLAHLEDPATLKVRFYNLVSLHN